MNRSNLSVYYSMLLAVCLMAATPFVNAETTKERVLRDSKVVLGIYNQNPWGFRDASGVAKGFEVDLVKAAASAMGVKEVEIAVTQFPALIPGLQAGRFDIATGGLFITPQRCKLVSFSETTLRVPDAAIVRKGNPKNIHSYADIAARKDAIFGATRGSINAQRAEAAGVPKDRQVLFQDNASTISALQSGRVDVMVSSAGAAMGLLSDPMITGVERVTPFKGHIENGKELDGNVALAFRLEDGDLRDMFDVQIRRMKADGTLKKIMAQYGFGEAEVAAAVSTDALCK